MENCKQEIVCELCLNNVAGESCQEIEDVTKEILKSLSLKLDLDKNLHLLCSACLQKLYAAFDFKSTCSYIENLIFSYVDSKEVPLDLREVFVKENGQSLALWEDQKVCRLCLGLPKEGFVSLSNVDSDIISTYIPDINLEVSKDPIACESCLSNLKVHYNFITNCKYPKKSLCNEEHPMDTSFTEVFIKTEKIKEESDSMTDSIEIKSELSEYEDSPEANRSELETEANSTEVQSYKCDTRNYATIQKKRIAKHDESSELKTYKCKQCSFTSKHLYRVNRHMLVHKDPLEIQMYDCSICGYRAKLKHHLQNHMLQHRKVSKAQLYECSECDYKTKYKYVSERHALRHISMRKTHVCDQCEYKTDCLGILKRHKLIHKDPSEIDWYKCDMCNFKAKYKYGLNKHLERHKNKTKWYKCDQCDYMSRTESNLLKHTKLHTEPKYECDSCDYKTTAEKDLKTHILTHLDSSEMWYRCNTCDYKSRRKITFNRHMLSHLDSSGIQWYNCETCDFKTTDTKLFDTHSVSHKDLLKVEESASLHCEISDIERDLGNDALGHQGPSESQWYKCDMCDYKTERKPILEKHLLCHTGSSKNELYKCETHDYKIIDETQCDNHDLSHKDVSEAIHPEMCDNKGVLDSGLKKRMSNEEPCQSNKKLILEMLLTKKL